MSVRRGKTVGTRQKWGVQSHKSKKMITTTKRRKKNKRERERDVILFISCSNISMVVVVGGKKDYLVMSTCRLYIQKQTSGLDDVFSTWETPVCFFLSSTPGFSFSLSGEMCRLMVLITCRVW